MSEKYYVHEVLLLGVHNDDIAIIYSLIYSMESIYSDYEEPKEAMIEDGQLVKRSKAMYEDIISPYREKLEDSDCDIGDWVDKRVKMQEIEDRGYDQNSSPYWIEQQCKNLFTNDMDG